MLKRAHNTFIASLNTMPVIVVHGGAAATTKKYKELKLEPLLNACRIGYRLMKDEKKTAIDAVEAAVRVMEDNPSFNAGHGSSLNANGEVECDALIMDGQCLKVGAVAGVTAISNPVSLARLVMEKSDHCFLIGEGAHQFAVRQNMSLIDPKELVTDLARERLEKYKDFSTTVKNTAVLKENDHDTVGAVALDDYGNIACATSTGGITAKMKGRVGDSPCVGSGGWADNDTCAVSTTGHGEAIMRVCLAKHIASSVEQGVPLQESTLRAIRYMEQKVGGNGGAIAVDTKGNIGIHFTNQMAWAFIKEDENVVYGLDLNEKHVVAI